VDDRPVAVAVANLAAVDAAVGPDRREMSSRSSGVSYRLDMSTASTASTESKPNIVTNAGLHMRIAPAGVVMKTPAMTSSTNRRYCSSLARSASSAIEARRSCFDGGAGRADTSGERDRSADPGRGRSEYVPDIVEAGSLLRRLVERAEPRRRPGTRGNLAGRGCGQVLIM